jgi:AAA+ superfamily predicted ATPase
MDNNYLHIKTLLQEVNWLSRVIAYTFHTYFMHEDKEGQVWDIVMPDLTNDESAYGLKVKEWSLGYNERIALALVLAKELKPEILDVFLYKNAMTEKAYTEFGGSNIGTGTRFIPTVKTLVYILSANKPEECINAMELFENTHILIQESVLLTTKSDDDNALYLDVLNINKSWLKHFIKNTPYKRELSTDFPAQEITTPLNWNDLVLDDHVYEQVMEINDWLKHGKTLMGEWGLNKKIKPGYRCMFYGPPGTGKTLTASLLGKTANTPVYRIDISMLVSKYIGETEKNLAKVFEIAESQNWILFFDEADSLFGKRSQGSSANDRFANQGTAYLLQKIEDYPGVIVIATNIKGNLDQAFARRFQSTIFFPMPQADERQRLWENAFSGKCKLSPEIDIEQIAQDYELAGGSIINVLRYCAMKTINRNDTKTLKSELIKGLGKELAKENKTMLV